jgi:hypothetical protein
MPQQLHIVAAANTLAPALAELIKLGFSVSGVVASASGESFYRAKKAGLVLDASDTLELLGLATLAERRGATWAPSDSEIEALLDLDGSV